MKRGMKNADRTVAQITSRQSSVQSSDRDIPVNIRYNEAGKQFSDCYSRLGVSDNRNSHSAGIGRAHLASQREGKTFLEPAITIDLFDQKHGMLPSRQREIVWLPYGYIQRFVHDAVQSEMSIVFAATDVIALVINLIGIRRRSGLTMLCQGSTVAEDSDVTITSEADRRRLHIGQTSAPTSAMQLKPEHSFRILTCIEFSFQWSEIETTQGRYRIVSKPFDLDADEKREFIVLCSAASYDCKDHQAVDIASEELIRSLVTRRINSLGNVQPEQMVENARRRWKQVEFQLPIDKIEREWRPLVIEAAVVLRKNTVVAQPEQGYGSMLGQRKGTFPARYAYEGFWIWDSAKQVWGLMEMDVELAMDNIRLFFDHQNPKTGELSMLHPDSMIPSAQAPLFSASSLLIWHILKSTGRTDLGRSFLYEIYDHLKLWNRWWFNACDFNGDGLCEWRDNLQSGRDDSPRWDTDRRAGFKNDFGCVRYSAVDLNAFLIADLRALTTIARELHLPEETDEWLTKADQLAARVVEVLYDEESNLFWDADVLTGAFHRIKTPSCFMPLLGGVPLPRETIRDMLERYLLDQSHFYGDVPFPSVAYSEEIYDAHGHSGYWRGPTWLSDAYFMLSILEGYRMLLNNDYADRIDEARKRLMALVLELGPCENYVSRRNAASFRALSGNSSSPHFSWTAACSIAIAARNYQSISNVKPIPPPRRTPVYIGVELIDRHLFCPSKELFIVVTNRADRQLNVSLHLEYDNGNCRNRECTMRTIDTSDGKTTGTVPIVELPPFEHRRLLVNATPPMVASGSEQPPFRICARFPDGTEAGYQRLILLCDETTLPWPRKWANELPYDNASYLLWDFPPFDFTYDDQWISRSGAGLIGRNRDGILWSRFRLRANQSLSQHWHRFDLGKHMLLHTAGFPILSPFFEAIKSIESDYQLKHHIGGTALCCENRLLELLERVSSTLLNLHEHTKKF